jgi:AraC-like DNA-binding protein
MDNFAAGDLVMIGANVPHCWKSSPRHYKAENGLNAKARVILFREDSFGKEFFGTQEFKNIRELLRLAQRGICFTGHARELVAAKMEKAYEEKGVKRFLAFLDILNDLAETEDYALLTGMNYKSISFENDMQRLNKVFDFLMNNFNKPLKLEEVAAVAYMSPTAFCRYFKSHTNKTVVNFLNELRIGFAKKLLIEQNENISNIYYSCGFRNASNFYEQFRKAAGCSPLEFRKRHEMKMI